MFTERSGKQNKLEMVILKDLVPKDHLLRKIDKAIDFSFINKICKPYYCENNGRPAIEPEVLFRMLFIGYLYGIRSETRLLKEIEVNVAYRWFIGYDLTEKLPDVSVIWQNRLRRYNDTDVPQQIFDEIVRQAMAKGLVGGKIPSTNSSCTETVSLFIGFAALIAISAKSCFVKALVNLHIDQTQELLATVGFTLSRSNVFDKIIRYFIHNKNYNIFEINEALFEFDQTLLGNF